MLYGMTHGIMPIMPRGYTALGERGWVAGVNLQAHTQQIQQLEDERATLVAELRERGASWAVIGWLVGTSGEAARKRWGDVQPAQRRA